MLDIAGLRKNYNALEVLKGIDLEVAPQELVFVIGPSGSGKSTVAVALEQALTANQLTRIAGAYKAASAEAVEGFCKVLLGMIDESDQRRFIRPGRPEDQTAAGRVTAGQAVRGRDGR